MKKILVGIAAFAMTLTCFAGPTVFTDTQIDGTLEVTGATTLEGATASSLVVSGALSAPNMLQANTNANINVTLVVPTARGSWLYAVNNLVVGTTTGNLAVAVGATTNDWFLVK